MTAFDHLIKMMEAQHRKPGRFKELCNNVFGTVEGAELMAMLCTIEHPMDHSYCPDDRAASHHAGRREVIAALWRYSSGTNEVFTIPTQPEPTQPT